MQSTSSPKRPLIEEVSEAQAAAARSASAPGQGTAGVDERSSESDISSSTAQQSRRAEFLEVGVTARPQGHSLDMRPDKPFSAPVPPSALLARLEQFLPQIAKANEDLAQEMAKNPGAVSELDIERVEASEEDDEEDDEEDNEGDTNDTKMKDSSSSSSVNNEEGDKEDEDDGVSANNKRMVEMNIALYPLENASEDANGEQQAQNKQRVQEMPEQEQQQ